VKLSQRGYAAQPIAPGTLGESGASGPFRPHNTAWTPAMSSASAYERQRVGGAQAGLGSHIVSAQRLAQSLLSRPGWSTSHMLHADPLDRVRRMRSVGLSNEHIAEWGQDTWNTAHHLMRQARHHGGPGSPRYDTGPRDIERFDNQYQD